MAPRIINMLDFDVSRSWTSPIAAALVDLVSETVVEKLVAAAPEFIEDAFDLLLVCTIRLQTASKERQAAAEIAIDAAKPPGESTAGGLV